MSNYKVIVNPRVKSPKLFNSKILEYLSKTHPLVIDGLYISISVYMIYHYAGSISQDWLAILGFFVLGYFSWTLAE